MATQTEADLVMLAEREDVVGVAEASEVSVERSRDFAPAAAGAAISIAQSRAMIEARDLISSSRHIPSWRTLVDSVGFTPEQLHDRLNSAVARSHYKSRGRSAIVAVRVKDWVISGLQPSDYAEEKGIKQGAFQANLASYGRTLLDPDLRIDTEVDYLDPDWIQANTAGYSKRVKGQAASSTDSKQSKPRGRRGDYRPSVPDDWHAPAPVSLGIPGLRPPEPRDDDNPLSWQLDALCAQTDPEAFFPEKGGSTRDAKRICTTCEVKAQCLDYALQNDERFGIWGGLSERERRRLRRPLRSA